VTGGLAPELVRIAEQSPIPIIATEGIGLAPMSTPAFSLLATHDGREASISAVVNSRWGVRRPEIVIVLPAEEVPPEVVDTEVPLRIGTQVRLIRAPYRGLVGTVTALPAHARPIECGARVRGAEVNVGQGTSVFVPLANLEIVR
jgi:hypothetical protein